MQDSINDILLHRFFCKEATEHETNEILQWVSESDENRSEFQKAHEIFHLSKLKQFQSEIDIDIAWKNLNNQLSKTERNKILYINIFRKVAVSILLLLSIGISVFWTTEYFFSKSKSAIVQFESPNGEKSKIILADGSLVWLNSNTIIKYDVLTPRKVTIEGEGYFEVKKDIEHPFEVTTLSGMQVKVTGTKFNLRSYAEEPYVETTLEEGGVVITKDNLEMAVLKPGQQAIYSTKQNELNVDFVTTEDYSIWKNNELQLRGIPFSELIPKIERWYGVSIELDPKISNKDQFTMTIKTESLRELLNMMQLTSKFRYEINGSIVKIQAK